MTERNRHHGVSSATENIAATALDRNAYSVSSDLRFEHVDDLGPTLGGKRQPLLHLRAQPTETMHRRQF